MSQGKDGSVAEQGFFQNDAHVDGRLAQSAVADAECLNEFIVPIEQHHPRLFYVEVLHAWVEIGVDGFR